MGTVASTSVLKATDAAEWARLMTRLAATGATAQKPMPPFRSVKINAVKRTLTVEQDIAVTW